jgi:hypothetical protein
VAVGILEIDSTTAVVVADFTRLCLRGIGPVGKLPLSNTSKNFVELSLANKKRVVLRLYWMLWLSGARPSGCLAPLERLSQPAPSLKFHHTHSCCRSNSCPPCCKLLL